MTAIDHAPLRDLSPCRVEALEADILVAAAFGRVALHVLSQSSHDMRAAIETALSAEADALRFSRAPQGRRAAATLVEAGHSLQTADRSDERACEALERALIAASEAS